jgi:hypothetical protein
MKIVATVLIASLLMGTSAFAADTGVLAAGKPAGVRKAQMLDSISPLVYFGVIGAGIGIALAVTSPNNGVASGTAGSGGGSGSTTTTTTGTTA